MGAIDLGNLLWGFAGVLITLAIGLAGLWLQNRWNERSAAAEQQSADEQTRANAPTLEVVALFCDDRKNPPTELIIENKGNDPARDVRVTFAHSWIAAEFPLTPSSVEVLNKGERATLQCRAASIHILNPYAFGRAEIAVLISCAPPHGHDRQQWERRVPVRFELPVMHPIVEPCEWQELRDQS